MGSRQRGFSNLAREPADERELAALLAGASAGAGETCAETHRAHDLEINPAAAVDDIESCGFVVFLLGHVAPAPCNETGRTSGESRLLAHEFYDLFAALTTAGQNGGMHVNQIASIHSGDVTARKLPSIEGPASQ